MRDEIEITFSRDFLRGYRRLRRRRPSVIEDFDYLVELFREDQPLPGAWRDHSLQGEWAGYREFHLGGSKNTLVIYRRSKGAIFFVDIGGHEDFFLHRKRREKGSSPPAPDSLFDDVIENTARLGRSVKKWWRG